jgi:N-acetylglucosaminyldiphosphoundecaprenol N-acetyl-beta-D-mannosaminyltransferase
MATVVDVDFFDGDIQAAVETVLHCCEQGEKMNRLVSATGAHGIVTAHQDQQFRHILSSFYLNLPDGMPAVWTSRLKGARQIQRCYGPDFFREVLVTSCDKGLRHYLCGGKEGVALELQYAAAEMFGNPTIVGVYSPPFHDMSDEKIKWLADDINARDVDIVWIGLSTPKQERFAFRLAAHTKVHFLCTVGAAFDFYTGRLRQAPHWMQAAGLEWLFRLMAEPGRLWRRYLTIVPLLVAYNIVDLFRYFTRSNREKKLTR